MNEQVCSILKWSPLHYFHWKGVSKGMLFEKQMKLLYSGVFIFGLRAKKQYSVGMFRYCTTGIYKQKFIPSVYK
jgi:hypothetical protein